MQERPLWYFISFMVYFTYTRWGCVYAIGYGCNPVSFQTLKQLYFACRWQASKNCGRSSDFCPSLQLTSPSTSGVSVPWVSSSRLGLASLDCGFSGLFSSRDTFFVPCCGGGATSRFSRSWWSSTLLFFSLNVTGSQLVYPGRRFSFSLLWADHSKQERKVQDVRV